MRSIPLLAATSVMLAAAWSCGGGSNVGPGTPVASFTVGACTAGAACQFTNTSTPATGLTYSWNFGDNTALATDASPMHTFAAAGSYQVALTVTDASNATNTKTTAVTVAGPAGPVAAFTVQCDGPACSFTDASTPTGALTYAWDFGEPGSGAANTSTAQNPTHTYNVTAVTPFTVTLKVTDAQSASGTTNQTITISPAANLQCSSGAGFVDCALQITQKATLTITLTGRHCEFGGNEFLLTQPIRQVLFFNGCSEPVGKIYTINGPNPDKSFNAGTQVEAQFRQGAGKPTDPPKGPAAIHLTGVFPTWNIAIDDGGNLGGVGEPDFTDLVMTVQATTVP